MNNPMTSSQNDLSPETQVEVRFVVSKCRCGLELAVIPHDQHVSASVQILRQLKKEARRQRLYCVVNLKRCPRCHAQITFGENTPTVEYAVRDGKITGKKLV